MQLFIAAASIFFLRLTDVTVGTIRSLYAVRGRRFAAAALGLAESSIFILAISRVMKDVDNPVKMLGYALGFSAGVFMGITIERWIASGTILAGRALRQSLSAVATLTEALDAPRGEPRQTSARIRSLPVAVQPKAPLASPYGRDSICFRICFSVASTSSCISSPLRSSGPSVVFAAIDGPIVISIEPRILPSGVLAKMSP